MLDKTEQKHVITTTAFRTDFGGGYQSECSCGLFFWTLGAAKSHAEVFNTQQDTLPKCPDLVQDVDMFPVMTVRWDRYTDEIHPTDEQSRIMLEAYRNN